MNFKGRISIEYLWDAPFNVVHELYRVAFLRSMARMEREKAEKEAEEKAEEERKREERRQARQNDPRHPLRRGPQRPTDRPSTTVQQPMPSLPMDPEALDELEDMLEEGM